jgi:hypothetical protein
MSYFDKISELKQFSDASDFTVTAVTSYFKNKTTELGMRYK